MRARVGSVAAYYPSSTRSSGPNAMEPEPEPPQQKADMLGISNDDSPSTFGAAADRRKAEGTVAFKDGNFSMAAAHYEAALSLAARHGDEHVEDTEIRQLVLALHLNLAAARLKMAEPTEALAQCDAALVVDPGNSKAMYRKGQALLKLGEPKDARVTLMAAHKLSPQDKQIISLLHKADAAAKQAKAARTRERQTRLLGVLVSELLFVDSR